MQKRLTIMRGLVSCGKSYRAKELVGDTGVIYSTDEFFYKKLHPEKPDEYSFDAGYLHAAHKWNQRRAQNSIEQGHPLIIIDNTNTTPKEFCCDYARYAAAQDYEVSIEEPTSDHWKTISELLRNRKENWDELVRWSLILEEMSKETHNVPAFAIEKMMRRWVPDLEAKAVLENCLATHKKDEQ